MVSLRIPQDEFYMKLAYSYAEQSTCLRRKVGAVIVRDGRQLSAGYNGAPPKIAHCTSDTCIRTKLNIHSGQQQELCRGGHAEQNAIANAAENGVAIKGSTLYCTTQPCIYCSKAIARAGIVRIVYAESYANGMDELTKEMLQNIKVEKYEFICKQ